MLKLPFSAQNRRSGRGLVPLQPNRNAHRQGVVRFSRGKSNATSTPKTRTQKELGKYLSLKSLVIATVMIAIVLGGYVLNTRDLLVVTEVEVVGNTNILTGKVDQLAQTLKGENLLTLELNGVASDIEDDPYTQSIFIKKRYPGKIIINIKEAAPHLFFHTLNQTVIFDEQGNDLSSTSLDETYPISESERLIYINPKPFRNELLKDRWLAENLDKEKEAFAEQVSESTQENPSTEDYGDSVDVGDKRPPDEQLPEEFKDFVNEEYEKIPLNELTSYYAQLRAEIISTTEHRWQELDSTLEKDVFESSVYSLIDEGDIRDHRELIKNNFYSDISENCSMHFSVSKIIVISPTTVQVNAKKPNGETVRVLFGTRKDLDKQKIELNTIVKRLEEENKQYKKIDLTGKKVVVA